MMAECEQEQNMEYRCRKCRHKLGVSEAVLCKFDNCLIDVKTEYRGEVFLEIEKCPYWIRRTIEKASFTKGKLSCLKCQGRLGSFDYIKLNHCVCGNHELPPLHLLHNRIDYLPVRKSVGLEQQQLWNELKEKPGDDNVPDDDAGDSTTEEGHHLNSRVLETDGMVAASMMVHERGTNERAGSEEGEAFEVKTRNRFMDLSVDTSDEAEEPGDVSPQQMDNRDTEENDTRELDIEIQHQFEEDDIPYDVTCVICYDLFYKPHRCVPCGHVYCEPCLRMLARDRPGNTLCPLCRTIIKQCVGLSEMEDELRAQYPSIYKERNKQTQKLKVGSFRLPSSNRPTPLHIAAAPRRHPVLKLLRDIGRRYVIIFFLFLVEGIWSFYTEDPFQEPFKRDFTPTSKEIQPFYSYLTQLCAKLFLVGIMYTIRRLKREVFGAPTIKFSMYLFVFLTCKDDDTWTRFMFSLWTLGSLVLKS